MHSPGVHRTFKSDQDLCILLISSLRMHPWLHNNYLIFQVDLDPWALPSDFFLKMSNYPVSSLILHLNYITMSSYFEYQVKSSTSFVTNSLLKFRSEAIFQFSNMAAPSCIDNKLKSLAHLIFALARGENMTFLRDYDVITWDSLPKMGKPPRNRVFGRCHPVMCMPITKLNVTISVLFKTSSKYKSHPFTKPPLAHPPWPNPFPHPSCPHPLAPFHNPFTQQFVPPCQK